MTRGGDAETNAPSTALRGSKNSKHVAAGETARDQLVGGEVGDDLAAVLGHHDLFLDAGGAGAVLGAFPGLEREHHAFFQWGVLPRIALGNDRPLPEREPDAVAVLQEERFGLVAIAEFLRVRPDLRH